MKHLKSYKLFEGRNWKAIPKEVYDGALQELSKTESINDVDELFSFIDYWMSVSDLVDYNPVEVKKRLESYYSPFSPPTSDEEWFPMWCSDGDTVECIMNELSRVYADSSFQEGTQNCHKCGRQFTQKGRHESFCSIRCEDEYSKSMSDWR